VGVCYPLDFEASLLDLFGEGSGENEGDESEEEEGLKKRRHVEDDPHQVVALQYGWIGVVRLPA
jgi:hypothetical protein